MSFEVVTAVNPKYVRVTASGEYSLERVFGFIDRVRSEADKAARKLVLIDSRSVAGNMTDADRFFAGCRVAETFGAKLKAAVLMPAEKITKLGESVAVSRGARLLITDSEDEAIEWLLAD